MRYSPEELQQPCEAVRAVNAAREHDARVAALLQPSKQQQQRERLHDDAETQAQAQTQIQKSRRTRIGT